MAWLTYAKKIIEAQGVQLGLGIPGGFHPYTFNLSDSFGGPRWYPWEYDGTFETMLRDQYRYNPEYIPIGDQVGATGTGWVKIAEISPEELLGKPVENLQVFIIPERQEDASLAIVDNSSSEFRILDSSIFDQNLLEDIAKQAKAWEFMMEAGDKQHPLSKIYARRRSGNEKNGIFAVNGPSATPGFHFIWRDSPSPTPSNNYRGDTTENEWDNWRSTVTYK